MFISVVFLTACIVSILCINEEKNIEYTVFDYGLYDNVLDLELCNKQMQHMKTFEFYDASFRLPERLSEGHTTSMGNFHQCLRIKQDYENAPIEGKYCMIVMYGEGIVKFPILTGKSWLKDISWIEIDTNLTMKQLNNFRKDSWVEDRLSIYDKRLGRAAITDAVEFSLGLCIPKSCTAEHALIPITENQTIDFDYTVEFCRLPGDKPLAAADYVAIVIFSAIGLLTILSTAYDIRQRFFLKKDPVETSTILRCCSIYTNTKGLMTFDNTTDVVECIDGIKSLSIIWIIVGHLVLTYLSKYTVNIVEFLKAFLQAIMNVREKLPPVRKKPRLRRAGKKLREWGESGLNTWLMATEISVDTFFALSGLLLVYVSTKKMKQGQLLRGLHLFYLHRLLRIFPLLACAVLLQASLFHHVADGVDWLHMGYFVQMCREYWWSALLHVQNIVNPVDNCIPQSWYLSVAVQMHILSPIVLFWVLGSRRTAWIGLSVGGGILMASTVYIFLKDFSEGDDFDMYYYKNTLTRCPPFLVGMFFGYILHVFRGKKLELSMRLVVLGYLAASGVSIYCLYSFCQQWVNELVISLNQAFVRFAWSICVCWLVFACAHGYGGPINRLLSLKIWKFVARISYAMYLFHYSIIFAISSSKVTSRYFSVGNIFLEFSSVMVCTVMASAAAFILIEAPCMTLQNILLRAMTRSSKMTDKKYPETTPLDNEVKL